MQLKPGVRLLGVRPELLIGLSILDGVWKRHGAELTITSVIDGVHKRASEHYSGCAADLRVHGLTNVDGMIAEAQSALGPDFDLIHEGFGTPNAHVHLEYQPKLAY